MSTTAPEDTGPIPPVIGDGHTFEPGEDPSRFLVNPRSNRGKVGFYRPYLRVPDSALAFTWPMPLEGFQISGSSELGIHKYLGGLKVDVFVTHRDEQRVTLSGTFPGKTSTDNLKQLVKVLRAKQPKDGKELFLPELFENYPLLVAVADYSFGHGEGQRGYDITYSCSFLRIGISDEQEDLPDKADPGPSGNATKTKRKVFKVTKQTNTLRKVAKKFYDNVDQWEHIWEINKKNKKLKTALGEVKHWNLGGRAIPAGTPVWIK
jgi:hypothetical protein